MHLKTYLEDKQMTLILNAFSAFVFAVLLYMVGNQLRFIFLLLLCWAIILTTYIGLDYHKRKVNAREVLDMLVHLDKKYLAAEIMDLPPGNESRIYFTVMRQALKSMTDETSRVRRDFEMYKEFVEQWVHDLKVPVTGIWLVCENNKTPETRKIMSQVEQLEADIEKVLYYARLGTAEKDYLISKIDLRTPVMNVLKRYKQILIQSQVALDTSGVGGFVYSDAKWIEFILGQILLNSIKYQSKRHLTIRFTTIEKEHQTILSVTDNGIGILPSELGRIFDKGFTGTNGRTRKKSTGMGLYLCYELCQKLGMNLTAESEEGQYTRLNLIFPKNDI